MFTQGRAHAQAYLPNSSLRTVCAVVTLQDTRVVMVGTIEGMLYTYELSDSPEDGCKLLAKHNLLEMLHSKSSLPQEEVQHSDHLVSHATSGNTDDSPPTTHFTD